MEYLLQGAGLVSRLIRITTKDLFGFVQGGKRCMQGSAQLDEDPRPGALAEDGREALGLGADALLDQFATLGEDADLTSPLVDVDANMVHGWPLLSAALTACNSCGAGYVTTSSGRPAAFITSIPRKARSSPARRRWHRGPAERAGAHVPGGGNEYGSQATTVCRRVHHWRAVRWS